MFELRWTVSAESQFAALRDTPDLSKRFKAVKKAVGYLRTDPRHPSLKTHKWQSENCAHGGQLFEAYAENNTPGAYRIFFCYVPSVAKTIEIFAITPHP